MSRIPSKASNNIYCKARLEASKENPIFASRESTAFELNISKDSLADYELGLCKSVPVNRVIDMADTYKASYLLNNYCSSECPIGKRIAQPIDMENINNVYKFVVTTINNLEESSKIQEMLLRIAKDEKIDKSKKEDLDYVLNFFIKIQQRASELRIISEKIINTNGVTKDE